MTTTPTPEIKLNKKGQCPFCKIKPIIYKRDKKYFCAKCCRDFDLQTGIFQESWHWTKDNQCKHPGRPKKSKCPDCGKWDNEEEVKKLYPTPDKLAEAKRILKDYDDESHMWTDEDNLEDKYIKKLLAAQNLVSRAEQEETPMGASQWREYGKKYGYWDYFLKEQKEIILSRVMSEYEKHNYMNPDEFNAIVRAKLNYQNL